MTNYELAIDIFETIDQDIGLDSKYMADLGSGTGMLSIAGIISGIEKCVSVEMDTDAIEIF